MSKTDDKETNFKFTSDSRTSDKEVLVNEVQGSSNDFPSAKADEPLFNWSAPDSFYVSKSFFWYFTLLVITVALSAVIYFFTKDKITTAVILISGLLLGIYAGKKPKMIDYQLTKFGFTINGRYHRFGEYRSFSVSHHGDGRIVALTPLKRFMPYTYINFTKDLEQQITTALTESLPKEITHGDSVDKILRKIGF